MATADAVRQAIDVYTAGTKAWFPDEEEAWVSTTCQDASVSDDGKVLMHFAGDNDGKEYVFEATLAQLEKNNASTLPPLRNPPKMESTDDLTTLSYLNEPAVLNTIRTRYTQRLIYTYSGIVLIAMNPFDRVALYDSDIVQQYAGRRRGELEPHLFAIAEDAYRCMIREKQNQTIVVSGESGAGKTVSAKYIMRYFATADDQESVGRTKKTGGMTEVEEQILATNPIMEAFGNAKTTRNDNSSRFGKYIEIQFDSGPNIVGAKIRTYLLERSRLIFQPATERNYHIFYQLCAGVPASERKEFELAEYSKFHYLNQSGTGTVPGVDDAQEFEITQRALSTVGLSLPLQWKIFRLLAALLHIGNMEITGRNDAALSDSDPALLTATRLLGIKTSDFRKWIVRKQIVTRSEKIVTNLSPVQAQVVRDSVAKYVYANLFQWLVGVVNESLSAPEPDKVAAFIGVLDIYGFEHFEKNSFEQFCINYANEKLQQQFNQHVFKLEQEEYVREKINWTFIEFSDNQKCIELIEAKLGILSLLDEESRLPSGTDQGFCQKLYQNFDNPAFKTYFKKPRFSNNAFTIAHYAHDVQYEAENFLDKNKDTVPDEHLQLLQDSEFDFLTDVLEKSAALNPTPATDKNAKRMSMAARKPTLGSIFKFSLIQLMETIGDTNVHYIRCIKPNEAKVAWEFEPNMVLAQLRACGVLETIRISCAGYPSRWTFEEFADRYFALVPSKHWNPSAIRELCSTILETTIKDTDRYQVGETKIFFRAGQLAYMEKLRAEKLNQCATLLQKNMRRFIYRSRYMHMRDLAQRLQCVARRKVAQAQLETLRQERAAVKIQSQWRRHAARKAYLAQQQFVLNLQSAIRTYQAKQRMGMAREHLAATQIQRIVRGWLTRTKYQAQRTFVIRIQSCVRRRAARKELMGLRREARSVNHFKEVSYKLENKVVELTQTVTALKNEKQAVANQVSQLEAQIQTWSTKYEKLEGKNKALETRLQQPTVPQTEWDAMLAKHTALQGEHQEAIAAAKAHERTVTELRASLESREADIAKLQKAVEDAQTAAANSEEVAELKSQNQALKAQLAQAMRPQQQRRQLQEDRSVSPAPRGKSPVRDLSPAPPDLSQLLNRKARRSSAEISTTNKARTVVDKLKQQKNPRPTSIDQYAMFRNGPKARSSTDDPDEEIHQALRDEDTLVAEITEGLIRSLKMPLPSVQNPASRKEILFPSHMVALCVAEMWRLGYIQESERLLFTVMDTIQKQCLSYVGEEAVTPCVFWLSNVHELLSLICLHEQALEQDMLRRAWHDFEKLLATVKYELQCLEDNIFHAWMKEIKQKLQKMIVPAVIESQTLPGFVTTETSGRFFRLLTSKPSFSMDDLLTFLNKVHRALSAYYIEPSLMQQALNEVLRMIGSQAFNDLLMRKNFASWKRAMQIQYNITRLEEWCKNHDVPEASLQLEHLMQSTKLLQLKKATLEDIENIYDVCWILSPTQVHRLMSNYYVADYEDPIKPEVMKAVAAHVDTNNASDVLMLDSVPVNDTTQPYEVPLPRDTSLQTYLPAWIDLKHVRTLSQMSQLA